MSLAILNSETATVRNVPLTIAAPSLAPSASNRSAAGTSGYPVRAASRSMTRSAKSSGALSPVSNYRAAKRQLLDLWQDQTDTLS